MFYLLIYSVCLKFPPSARRQSFELCTHNVNECFNDVLLTRLAVGAVANMLQSRQMSPVTLREKSENWKSSKQKHFVSDLFIIKSQDVTC